MSLVWMVYLQELYLNDKTARYGLIGANFSRTGCNVNVLFIGFYEKRGAFIL